MLRRSRFLAARRCSAAHRFLGRRSQRRLRHSGRHRPHHSCHWFHGSHPSPPWFARGRGARHDAVRGKHGEQQKTGRFHDGTLPPTDASIPTNRRTIELNAADLTHAPHPIMSTRIPQPSQLALAEELLGCEPTTMGMGSCVGVDGSTVCFSADAQGRCRGVYVVGVSKGHAHRLLRDERSVRSERPSEMWICRVSISPATSAVTGTVGP